MEEPRRWAALSEPLKGAGFVIALAILVCLVGTGMAGLFVWVMT